MNEISTIEMPTSTSLVTIEAADLATIISTPGQLDVLLERIKTDARARAASLDISTEKGRKAIASLAKTYVAGAKVQIVTAANQLTEGWRDQTAAVVVDRKRAEADLDALRDEVRKPLTDWQSAEADRVKAHEGALADIEILASVDGRTADEINERIWKVPSIDGRAWQEFKARAERVITVTLERLKGAHAIAVQREEASAQAERERQAEVEQKRVAGHRAAIQAIASLSLFDMDAGTGPDHAVTSADAAVRIAALQKPHTRDWEEFAQEAADQRALTIRQLQAMHDHIAASEAIEKAAREAKIASDAAEAAKQEAEAKAEQAAQRADYHRRMLQHVKDCGFGFIGGQAQSFGILQYELTKKIKFDEENFGDLLPEALAAKDEALNQIQRAIDEGNRRQAEEEARQATAAALEKSQQEAREAEQRAETQRRAKLTGAIEWMNRALERINPDWEIGHQISNIDSVLTRIPELMGEHEWQDMADQAVSARDAATERLTEKRDKLVVRQAEVMAAIRQQQAEQAQRDADAAVEAERQRVAAKELADKAAAERLAKNVAHRKRIERDVLADVVEAMQAASPTAADLSDYAKAIIAALAAGRVRHTTINYGSAA